MTQRFNPTNQRFFDDNGNVANGYKLRFKEPSSDTLKDTYTDSSAGTPNSNPVVLDSDGQHTDIWLDGEYKVEFLNTSDVEQWEVDPIGVSTSTSAVNAYSASTTYGVGDVVQASNDEYYMSITASNTGNDPTSTPANWTLLAFQKSWNTNETYDQYDIVKGSDGNLFTSVAGSNSGNDPVADDGTNWTAFLRSTDVSTSSWTPVLTDISNNATHSTQEGQEFILNDDLVFYTFEITITSKGSLSGGLYIEGLSNAGSSSKAIGGGVITYWANMSVTSGESVTITGPSSGQTRLQLYLNDSTSDMSQLDASEINTNFTCRGFGFYFKA